LGWIPRVKFESGVAKMLENIHLWDDAPLWEVDQIAEATKTWNEYLGRNEF
jgi:UDP-glucose 4-epimerase